MRVRFELSVDLGDDADRSAVDDVAMAIAQVTSSHARLVRIGVREEVLFTRLPDGRGAWTTGEVIDLPMAVHDLQDIR